MKKILSFISLIFLGTTLVSCGYTTSSALPGNLKTVHIEAFENKIGYTENATRRNLYFPLLEVDVRNEIVDRFLFDGNLKVTKEGDADLILRGVLKDYSRSELRKTDNDDIEEYRIHVTVGLELWDVNRGDFMWVENNFSGEATYFVTGPEAVSEEAAVQEAVTDLARRIVERTIEDW